MKESGTRPSKLTEISRQDIVALI